MCVLPYENVLIAYNIITDRDLELAMVTSDAISDLDLGVIFTCVGFDARASNISISWMDEKNNSISTGGVFCVEERNFYLESYKFQQSFLQIKGIMCINAGEYTCSVTNGKSTINYSMTLYLRSEYILS